jgi:hypothetical protein
MLANLERISNPSPAFQAAAASRLGERDAAFAWLHRACAQRSMGVHWLKVEPIWDPLRSHPRLPAVLRELRLGD